MTTPSRRHEIFKRRARKRKINLLRRRYQMAASEAEKSRILSKLARLSPTMTVEQFTNAGRVSS